VDLPVWFETTTFVVLGTLLLVDLALVARRPHEPSLRECTGWVVFYISLALAFAVLILLVSGRASAGSFVAGWLTEYSLSVDNLFVFMIIMSRFSVPRAQQQEVLMAGIILSLVLRGGCIMLGAAAIERFSWVFYLFGAFLIYTAVQLLREREPSGPEYSENLVVRRLNRVLPVSPQFHGRRLVATVEGRRMLTPIAVVFVAIGTTDLLFAFDSIPAIFGLTRDPFIVFTATIFALMGLRQLYFLLGGLLQRLVYLSVGLSVLLGFIGVKLILEALHANEVQWLNGGDPVEWAPVVPIWLSLTVILTVLAITTVASLLADRRRSARAQGEGPVRAEDPDPEPSQDPEHLRGRLAG
jgi:tellurite resistance protein TerC